MTPPPLVDAAIRSVIWLGGAAGLAYVKKPDGASVLAVRQDAIGWLAGGIFVAGLALHVWWFPAPDSLGRAADQRGSRPTGCEPEQRSTLRQPSKAVQPDGFNLRQR